MKKFLALVMVLIASLSLAACSEKSTTAPSQSPAAETASASPSQSADSANSKTEFVSMTFGDITMNVPSVFNAVAENKGMYVSAGPDSSIVVTPAAEIDMQPSEWDESLARDSLDPLYGSTYTDMKLSAFQNDVNMNGNPAVYLAFNGKNAEGKDRLVQVIRLYTADMTSEYTITFLHSANDKFFTSDVSDKIINSITLGK